MPDAREKLLRDPVHDLIVFDLDNEVDDLLLRLIDTREFQRLRRIRQLGMAHLAYHGAEHSRFSHSIGVMHLARRMLTRLEKQSEPVDPLERAALLCAALLHDIGHGPFSHVMETFFSTRHEEWSRRIIIDPGTEVGQLLARFDPALPARTAAALTGDLKPGWLNFIVSSQLDADRFDYLLRDSHMTGVKYGVFDLERLLLMLRVSGDGERLYILAKGLLPVEKYLQSRYHMYRQMYFHKTVTAAEAMLMAILERAGELAREDKLAIPDVESPMRAMLVANDSLTVAQYLALDDAVFQDALGQWASGRSGDVVLGDLATRLQTRRLFKSIEVANRDEADLVVDMRVRQAEAVLSAAGLDPRYYLRYGRSADTPYRPYNPRGDRGRGTIWMENPGQPGDLVDVKDVSPTIRAFTESPYMIWRAFFPESTSGTELREAICTALNQ